jgi:heptosyltransferase III
VNVWIFHRAALGDFILTWPLVRGLAEQGREVVIVTDGSKARLAGRFLGVRGLDAEQPRFNGMWAGRPGEPESGVAEVWSFITDPATGAGRSWLDAAGAMFPGAAVRTHPQRTDRIAVSRFAQRCGVPLAHPDRRSNPGGPILAHVGAGSESKRWPIDRWSQLAATLKAPIRFIAGEVEAERFSKHDRETFAALGGRYLDTLDELADAILPARLFIGADSGPSHLAAQLGLPTLALFGPTDPARWSPAGPAVRVLAPPQPQALDWLGVGRVAAEARAVCGS